MADELYQIYSSIEPIAHSGDTVEIVVTQTLTAGGVDYLSAAGPNVTVTIQGPQLALSEDDIVGVYPGPGSTDSPDNFLPHIALKRKTLPWERQGPGPLPPNPNAPTVPWMALLVLTAGDLLVTPALAGAKPPALQTRPIQVADLAASDSKTHTILQGMGIADASAVNVLAIPNSTLSRILPAAEDLALLCHAKEVDQAGGDGMISVIEKTITSIVVAGRLPYADDSQPDVPPALHMAALVSLEGRTDVYGRLAEPGINTLIVLHSWTFTPSKGFDFEEVCKMIGYVPNGGVLRFGNLPVTLPDPAKAPLSGGFDALLNSHGFFLTPLDHTEAGNVAWRGPLRPFPPPARSDGVALRSDPEELDDQAMASFADFSHATAFELGKLLALSDPGTREALREIHLFLKTPQSFVAMADLPESLQKRYWGDDTGDPALQSAGRPDQAFANRWNMAGNQSLAGMDKTNVVTQAEASGVSSLAAVSSLVPTLNLASATTAATGLIDLAHATEAMLQTSFPEVQNAATTVVRS